MWNCPLVSYSKTDKKLNSKKRKISVLKIPEKVTAKHIIFQQNGLQKCLTVLEKKLYRAFHKFWQFKLVKFAFSGLISGSIEF